MTPRNRRVPSEIASEAAGLSRLRRSVAINTLAGSLCIAGFVVATTRAHPKSPRQDLPDGNAKIRAKAGASEIVITTTARVAGAVHSLRWGNQEFIDSTDHGRQLQSACSFDCGSTSDFWAEAFNPTEAGSRDDAAGPTSSSRLHSLRAHGAELETTTQMAFWLAPGEESSGHTACNRTVLSDYLVSKRIHIGYRNWPHALQYEVTFEIPRGARHKLAQFEAVTGYMPSDFSRFWRFDARTAKPQPLDDGPGEQSDPVILATPDGSHAMGVYSPEQPSKGHENLGYGRFRFPAQKVVKWNCVFRLQDSKGLPAGKYKFRSFVMVGTLDDVTETMAGLCRTFRR
jgi:hypothetical protein